MKKPLMLGVIRPYDDLVPSEGGFQNEHKNGFQTMHDMIATSPFRLGFLGLIFDDFIA